MYPDFLTCGKCAEEFPLSKIDDFIIHKTSCLQSLHGQSYSTVSPDAALYQALLTCVQCGLDFHTARGLLQHLQSTHQMDIVILRTPVSAAQHDFFSHQNQQNTFSTVTAATDYSIAGDSSGHIVNSGSASSGCHSTDLVHTAEDVSMSPAVKQELPMACAKLAASEGTTICCNGQECKVTINPPSRKEQPKKCCSSVVPKKRTRHMQEHDSEDMEQSALKTLAGFRGRFMLSHKAKTSHSRLSRKKSGDATSKSTHKRKAKCVLRCETESGKVNYVKNTDFCEEVEEEEEDEGCRGSDEKEKSDASSNDDSDCEPGERKQKIKLYSIEKENITSRKTVITNTGVTLTLEPTEPTKSKQREGERYHNVTLQPPSDAQNQAFDASRESAEILAELLCHARQPSADPSILMPNSVQHNTVKTAGFSQVPLVSRAEGSGTHPLVQPSASALIPSNIVYPAMTNPFTPADVTASPTETSAHVPVSKPPTHLTTSTSMDIQQVDLSTVSPSIRLFDSLDQSSNDGLTIAVPEATVSLDDQTSSSDPKQDSPVENSGKGTLTGSGKKRRYPTTRPYKCSQCEQAFNQPIHLKKHMSKHTGVKPFKCDQCEYSTVERSHLKAHNRIHTGEKPFQCNFCSYATAQNSTLRVHLKRHHSNQVQVQAATSNTVLVNQQSL